jgi:hypothetical protein
MFGRLNHLAIAGDHCTRLALLRKCRYGRFALADPDGTRIDVDEGH